MDTFFQGANGYMLFKKIDSYGRVLLREDGDDIVTSEYGDYSNVRDVTAFNELEKGCETWVEGHRFPIRGCIQDERIDTVIQIKRLLPTMVKTFNGNIFSKIITIGYFKKNWKYYLDFLNHALRNVYYIKEEDGEIVPAPELYSQPVRELYRVMSGWNVVIDKIRNVLCSFIEHDSAYKYRFQDVFGEFDVINFQINPIKELSRVLDLMFFRESKDLNHGMGKFKKITPIALLYLRLNRKLLKQVKEILSKIEIDEIKMNESDKYWSGMMNYSYRFGANPV